MADASREPAISGDLSWTHHTVEILGNDGEIHAIRPATADAGGFSAGCSGHGMEPLVPEDLQPDIALASFEERLAQLRMSAEGDKDSGQDSCYAKVMRMVVDILDVTGGQVSTLTRALLYERRQREQAEAAALNRLRETSAQLDRFRLNREEVLAECKSSLDRHVERMAVFQVDAGLAIEGQIDNSMLIAEQNDAGHVANEAMLVEKLGGLEQSVEIIEDSIQQVQDRLLNAYREAMDRVNIVDCSVDSIQKEFAHHSADLQSLQKVVLEWSVGQEDTSFMSATVQESVGNSTFVQRQDSERTISPKPRGCRVATISSPARSRATSDVEWKEATRATSGGRSRASSACSGSGNIDAAEMADPARIGDVTTPPALSSVQASTIEEEKPSPLCMSNVTIPLSPLRPCGSPIPICEATGRSPSSLEKMEAMLISAVEFAKSPTGPALSSAAASSPSNPRKGASPARSAGTSQVNAPAASPTRTRSLPTLVRYSTSPHQRGADALYTASVIGTASAPAPGPGRTPRDGGKPCLSQLSRSVEAPVARDTSKPRFSQLSRSVEAPVASELAAHSPPPALQALSCAAEPTSSTLVADGGLAARRSTSPQQLGTDVPSSVSIMGNSAAPQPGPARTPRDSRTPRFSQISLSVEAPVASTVLSPTHALQTPRCAAETSSSNLLADAGLATRSPASAVASSPRAPAPTTPAVSRHAGHLVARTTSEPRLLSSASAGTGSRLRGSSRDSSSVSLSPLAPSPLTPSSLSAAAPHVAIGPSVVPNPGKTSLSADPRAVAASLTQRAGQSWLVNRSSSAPSGDRLCAPLSFAASRPAPNRSTSVPTARR